MGWAKKPVGWERSLLGKKPGTFLANSSYTASCFGSTPPTYNTQIHFVTLFYTACSLWIHWLNHDPVRSSNSKLCFGYIALVNVTVSLPLVWSAQACVQPGKSEQQDHSNVVPLGVHASSAQTPRTVKEEHPIKRLNTFTLQKKITTQKIQIKLLHL